MEDVLSAMVDSIVKTVDPDKIILFGSRNNGSARPESDYDILVLKHGIGNCRLIAHELYRSLVDIPVAVDILVETPEKIEKYKNTPGLVYAEALKGRVLYER